MTLVVNLFGTVSSVNFICSCWRNPWCDFQVTHTPKCSESAKIGQVVNCGLTILIVCVLPVLLTNYDTAQIWRSWQNGRYFYKTHLATCICPPNELKREIKKKTGGASKNLGGHGPPRPPLESPLPLLPCYCYAIKADFKTILPKFRNLPLQAM